MNSICVLCGDNSESYCLCNACINDFAAVNHACSRCGLPLAYGSICGACLQKPPCYDSHFSAYWYDYPIDRLIIAAKFNDKLDIARKLGQLLADALDNIRTIARPDAILPVPLHWKRQALRGYNQAIEIAKPLASHLEIPVIRSQCIRVHDTTPQTNLNSAVKRHSNVKSAFAISGELGYEHIAIVDDVITTGATVNAIAKLLRGSGCRVISAWSVARVGNRIK